MATLPKNASVRKEQPGLSLVRGGPFYQVQLAAHLIDAERWNLPRRLAFLICVAWVPLVLLTLFFQRSATLSLLSDYRVASRLLIASPILLIGQLVMDSRFRMIGRQIQQDLLRASDVSRFDSLVRTLSRLRDSIIPELATLALVVVHSVVIFRQVSGIQAPWAIYLSGGVHLTPAGWYYLVVSQVIYQFLVGLSLWKWLLWTLFLFNVSRMKLKLEASHPDKHGGVGFVGLSPLAFAPIALALTAAVGATWREQILHRGAHLMDFKFPALVLVALILIVAIGPMIFFAPKLTALRRQGILEYGSLAQLHSGEFYNKWILHRKGREEELLAAPEISSLIDLASSFQNIEDMKPVPLEKDSMVVLVVAVLLPALPTILTEIPLSEILRDLLEAAK